MNVLIVFHSRRGQTEHLALTVGVGAIQARANIRLRRLPPGAASETAPMTTGERENYERMSRDYVAPRPADPLWADVVVLAASSDSVGHLQAYVEQLPALGPMAGKIAAPVASSNSAQSFGPVYAAAANAGLVIVPPAVALDATETQHAHGRRIVAIARALKDAAT